MSVHARVRRLERLGLHVERTGSGHLRAWNYAGASVVLACTPGRGRAAQNERALVARLVGRPVPIITA